MNRVSGYGPVPADVMVVGEAPGRIEAETGVAWTGPLRRFMEALEEALPGPVYVTNAVQRPRYGKGGRIRKTTASDVDEDLELLREEIASVGARDFVAVGLLAQRALGALGVDHVRMPHPRRVRIGRNAWRRWKGYVNAVAKEIQNRAR